MSNSTDFLNEMLKAGEEVSDKPISKTIAKVKFELGFSGFCSGHNMNSLFRPMTEPAKNEEVKNAVSEHIKSLGGRGGAIVGLRYTIPAENIISFEAGFGKENFVQRYGEEADFDEIWEAIDKLGITINEWTWCAYNTIESPSAVAKGEDGKYVIKSGENAGDKVFPKIIVPIEKFANEQAARAAAGDGGSKAVDNSQWSDKARTSYPDIANLSGLASEVSDWYGKMIGGTPFANDAQNFPLPNPITPPAIKKQLAESYAVETADIDILLSMDVAF